MPTTTPQTDTIASSAEPAPATLLTQAQAVIAIEQAGIQRLADSLSQTPAQQAAFVQAVQLMANCPGRVVVTGMGKSGIIGKKIAATLSSTGTPSVFLHPAEGSHGDLGLLGKDDVVIAISNSGETPELLAVLPLITRLALPLIAMTGGMDSTLAQRATCTLDVGVEREACGLNLAPTASTTVTLVMGDVLAMTLMEHKGFTADDFALVHPAGALGKRLLLTVEDVMQSGEQLPLVQLETPFLDALLTISSKKLGLAVVTHPNGTIAGIVTDGDIRRALMRHGNAHPQAMHALTVADVMSVGPKTISPAALAFDALQHMETHKITALLVIHDHAPERLAGIIHLHDILRTGLRL